MKTKVVNVQFNTWDNPYYFGLNDKVVNVNDYVVVNTELGTEIGKVISLKEVDTETLSDPLKPIIRVAELEDLEQLKKNNENRKEAVKVCKQYIRKYNLPMKLVDCNFSFDDTRAVFAFTSDTRVDFRELVKDLTKQFQKKIRLQQIGIRDTLKQMGGIGPCGRCLCCNRFLDDLGNISTDLARDQQIEQRGSDRLSGACGRLKCCLAYEAEGYKNMGEKFPAIGTTIKTGKGKARVLNQNILKHSVTIRTEDDTITEEYLGCQKSGCKGCKANQYYQDNK
ncbi:stage 0 sporulation protein [Patescibacteria group bacterium]|nr:stage 0 sporulation protein [Patescibacteria group bacterium]